MTAPLMLCAICGYPVRDIDMDFEPDRNHAPCGAVIDRMEDDLRERRRQAASDSAWALRW